MKNIYFGITTVGNIFNTRFNNRMDERYDRRPKDTGLDDETIQNVMGKRVKMA